MLVSSTQMSVSHSTDEVKVGWSGGVLLGHWGPLIEVLTSGTGGEPSRLVLWLNLMLNVLLAMLPSTES